MIKSKKILNSPLTTPLMDCNHSCMTGYAKCTKAKVFSAGPCSIEQKKCESECAYWYKD